jgi:Bacterial regulatory helix-turn-helix protein, lysR family
VELRQIRSFLSVAETLHFGRTAELIHINQPALSLQIRALEEEVGVRLFERNRRKTTLTAAGAAFRDDAAAKRAGSHTVEVAGASRSVYVSHPKQVADVIESAARAVSK